MSNFYTNIVLKGASCEAVQDALVRMGRSAFFISARSDVTVVYDAETEGQDRHILTRLALKLSQQLKCVAWVVLNHDDDILWYRLYSAGNLEDEYDSTPGYFDPEAQPSTPSGGVAAKLANAFGCKGATEAIEIILRRSCFGDDGYTFALGRHRDLAEALGLSINLLALGYDSIENGNFPGITPEILKRVGN